MRIPGISEIRKELKFLDEKKLIELVLDLGKLNRENKAYLYFKLFEEDNPRLFIEMVQEELMTEFQKANTNHYHFAKKSAQAIRRKLNKNLKLTKDKAAHIDLLVFFCRKLKEYGYLDFRHPVIDNVYLMQMTKIEKLIAGLHEDLQYDYNKELEELRETSPR
ncbi:hypothetical protein [Negadavirga shengliensis]|uniref:Uncharacterized protein n=1 Tax=Negadavirga shengliensis TaxID=1389218 RepID=A0ABV9SZR8_9BACT